MFKKFTIALVLLIVLVLVAAGGLSYAYQSLLEPVNPAAVNQEIIIEIPAGANTDIIAALLEREGLIQNELAFRYYVRSKDLGGGFIAGKYQLSPAMSVESITSKIQAGDTYAETAWFTIPEGYTIEQIAARLDEEGLADEEIFLNLAADPSPAILETFPYLQDLDASKLNYLLEGYLFPDTYEIFTDASEEDIIKLMLKTMANILGEESSKRAEELNLTLHEVLTIASLVEREAAVDHERDSIAGVIHNRIAIGMRLQIDATIQYILGETKEFLTFADLEIPSPYNTYRNDGLPPGPIAASGKSSIEAALYPEDNEYFYYNYKYDGTGEHYFSYTYQEHLQNVRRAEENIQ